MTVMSILRRRAGLAGLSLLLAVSACDVRVALTDRADARRLASRLQTNLARAVDGGNAAVMSDREDKAAAAIGDARAAMAAASGDMAALREALAGTARADETRVLEAFGERLVDYERLEGEILTLVTESTNLKAQRLAFGAAAEQADEAVRTAARLVTARPDAQRWQRKALASDFAASLREIQALQSPHIGEANDDVMMAIEQRMQAAERSATVALQQLTPLVPSGSAATLAATQDAFARFTTSNREIVRLSRRNSNVRSLALALGRKRMVAAQAYDELRRLQEALAKRDDTGTR